MPVKYSVVKDLDCLSNRLNLPFNRLLTSLVLVGLGGIEPPTSPLSGVRSSHLSYRPGVERLRPGSVTPGRQRANLLARAGHEAYPTTGGAGRDRTGDLLNANQALSQLSYSPSLSANC